MAPRSMSDIALIGVFAALIAAFALTPAIPVGGFGVPITLQTLAVVLTGLVLGPWRAFAATALYVAVGLAGLPILAGGKAGIAVLVGPTAGYLLSFPFAAALAGLIAAAAVRRGWRPLFAWFLAAGLGASLLVTTPLGILGMIINARLEPAAAFVAALPYLPGDLIKAVAAAGIAVAVHKAFPLLLAPRLSSPS